MKARLLLVVLVAMLMLPSSFAAPQAKCNEGSNSRTPPELQAIDKVVEDGLQQYGLPSASIAIVRDGAIAYACAYGNSRLEPPGNAATWQRYAIGSISKQFTAAAVLLLAEDGKLTLDDKVSRYFPKLTRANEVSIRHLLSMTSGYQDNWPQDYLLPKMAKPTTPQAILDEWAMKPLDFEPGTKYQYSNTNYVIAGLVVEKVSGMRFFHFLQKRIFHPLGMKSATDIDAGEIAEGQAVGYQRFALGPPRPAPKEAKGWLYAMGGLAMAPIDLAKWNVALIERKVMKPASYREFTSAARLANGAAPGYALGINARMTAGRFTLSHSGEVMGFVANNVVYPEERVAITVLTNQMTGGAGAITDRIATLLFAVNNAPVRVSEERARKVFAALQRGEFDRSLFTENAHFYFNNEVRKDFADTLAPLGTPTEFVALPRGLRGGMIAQSYRVVAGGKRLVVLTFEMPDGKLDQFMVQVAD
ncbi:MAG: serine hydrolase domain-containing protein [Terriglobales bacterium]